MYSGSLMFYIESSTCYCLCFWRDTFFRYLLRLINYGEKNRLNASPNNVNRSIAFYNWYDSLE